jgi:tRNA(Ile)-lysidine synthase
MQLKGKILKTIQKYTLIENGESIVVGVSGGPDSICLLHVLYSIMKSFDIKLFVFHLNHMLRGDEANKEAEYVEDFCRRLELPLTVKAINIEEVSKKEGLSIEETARNVRYREFELYAKAVGATKIAVAHNKNDQAETILMRIIRGTGLEGLTGMDFIRGNIIRPLLEIDRSEIEEYCSYNLLYPKVDSSNLLNIFTRNKIRLELIPQINKLFETDIKESLFRMSELLKADNAYIEKNSSANYKQVTISETDKNIFLDIEKLKSVHIALIKRILRLAINKIKGNLKGIASVHLEAVVDLIFNGSTGSSLCLPERLVIEKSYNVLKIHRIQADLITTKFDYEIKIPGVNYFDANNFILEASIAEKFDEEKNYKNTASHSFLQYFDYEKFNLGINIRSRKQGDFFKPINSNGTKKLKEYLIDNKIPRENRDAIPILAKGNEVIWLVGYKISDKFKVTENTKNILKLEYKKI